MFSKPIIDYTMDEVKSNLKLITYEGFINNKISLIKYKVCELKYFLKQNNLHVSGNKATLIIRIRELFTKIKSAIIIQKIFRGFIVRYSNKLRGPAIKDRKTCINQCDFYTLEPLSDIVYLSFFSYTDNNGFIYGFDIFSLIYLMKKVSILQNPYNREVIDLQIIRKIISLYKIIQIIYPNHFINNNNEPVLSVLPYVFINPQPQTNEIHDDLMETLNDIINSNNSSPEPSPEPNNIFNFNNNNRYNQLIPTTNIRENRRHPNIENRGTDNITTRNLSRVIRRPTSRENVYYPVILNDNQNLLMNRLLINRLYSLTSMNTQTRIQELFIEIDLLGNYTQSTWFLSLEKREYIIFIHNLYDIWDYRANLTSDVKYNISPIYDPFREYNPNNHNFETFTISSMQKYCLDVMEPMVLSGTDIEHRKLGTLYILSALTIVSIPARNTMNWLYESLVY